MGKFNAFEEIITQQKDMKKPIVSIDRIFINYLNG